MDYKELEKTILGVVKEKAPLSPQNQALLDELESKYKDVWDDEQFQYYLLPAVVDYLVEKRYLWPYIDDEGKVVMAAARGITPKGLTRLEELEHPIRFFSRRNWFPITVAITGIVVGLFQIGLPQWLWGLL